MDFIRCSSACWFLAFFLLFVVSGAASLTVEGQKGGDITLACGFNNREDLTPVLIFGSKTAYGYNQDEHFRGRVQKRGSCDLHLRDLKTSDAGTYILQVLDNSQPPKAYTYHICVKVNVTAQEGEVLVLDLPHEAESIEHFLNTDWKEVWRREKGVLTDRLTEKNGPLTIVNFTSSDSGIYRALNSSGGLLVIVTVIESGTGVKDSTYLDETHGTKIPGWVWIVIGIGIVALVALIAFLVKKHPCQKKNEQRSSYEIVQMNERNCTGPVASIQ